MPCKVARLIMLACLLALSQQHLLRHQSITCPEGTTLKPKPGYTSVPNGCGGTSAQVQLGQDLNPFTALLTPCCNAHDICFGTCDSEGKNSFSHCNAQFSDCLKNQCAELGEGKQVQCDQWAGTYSFLVKELGSKFYDEDQLDACTCQ